MQIYHAILLSVTFLGTSYASCDKNLVPDLSYKLSGGALEFPCASTKNIYLSTGRYIPKNVIGTRMQIYKETAIIALPRYKPGVPFTLGQFCLKTKGCKATLKPFPCWPIQEEGNCDAIQSAVDIALDSLDILWVLDVGIVNTLEQPVKRCPPKLVGINAKTGQVMKVIDLSSFVTSISRLQYLVVDYSVEGKAFAYITDAGVGAIIVYDIFGNKGYRIVLPNVVTDTSPPRDVLYAALIRKSSGNLLYFTYLSSPFLFSVKASLLQDGKGAGSIVTVGPKPQGAEMVILGTDNAAALFFRVKSESDIYLWNTETAFVPDNFLLVQRGGDCRLATQVVPGFKRLVWAIESNFADFASNTVGCLGASMAVHPLVKTCD